MGQEYRFWPCVSAIQLLWAVSNSTLLRRCYSGSLIQYLGRVRYALYLMHGPVIHTFGYTVRSAALFPSVKEQLIIVLHQIMPLCWKLTGTETAFRGSLCLGVGLQH